MVREDPGAASLALVRGIVHLDEPAAVFEAMLTGWERQQRSRGLVETTVEPRLAFVRRFQSFAEGYPWEWTPADLEDFTVSLMSGAQRRSPATIRNYHLTLRMFCDYVTSTHYGWVRECAERFDKVPAQICFDYNTVAHLQDYEGRPERRPFSYDEIEILFDFLDDRVDRAARSGRKGGLAALRDAQMVKTTYAFGLRRRELCMLDVVDLRPNPHMPQWGTYGSVHVRFGKASRGGIPKRRTVLAVPEFDWVIEGMRQWVEEARWLADAKNHPALWVTERRSRVDVKQLDRRFRWIVGGAGLDPALTLHCLRHSYVTHLVEFGYPERFVTEQVGHRAGSTTAIYTSVSNDFKNKTLKAALARVYGERRPE